MDFKQRILDPAQPAIFFEMVPPAAGKPESLDAAVNDARRVKGLADAINLPEIHDENRGEPRAVQFVPRVQPRLLGARIRRELGLEVVVNRCVVYEPDQVSWLKKIERDDDIHHVVLVGGESSRVHYPGPGVIEAASQAAAAGLNLTLGGISIPSRESEAARVRRKTAAGLVFFTTQVLFDSNDIVWLVQRLNGLEARIFLSFAPVSHVKDIEFLRWLGADIPSDLDHYLLQGASPDLCQRILMDVFDNLPPDPPPIGLNIEHINRRNFPAAIQLLERLGGLYKHLVSARARASLA